MTLTRSTARLTLAGAGRCRATHRLSVQQRSIFNWLWRKRDQQPKDPEPVLSQDDLFHPLSKSPFPALRERAQSVQKLASCPVCLSAHEHDHVHTQEQPKAVKFECPDCGWPTHCSEDHWKQDTEHQKYCSRLRDANEDEHDLRSGRRFLEFEFPGPQPFDEAISFANWDVFWYTRGFAAMNTERNRRHCSKIMTFPITIGSTLHQFSPLMLKNQRVTPEGSRSLAALRTTLHVPPGTPETEENAVGKPQVRVFILGARYESSLPPHAWEQLALLFPAANLHLFFIGPQVAMPKPADEPAPSPAPSSSEPASSSGSPPSAESARHTEDSTSASSSSETDTGKSLEEQTKDKKSPMIWEALAPPPIPRLKTTRSVVHRFGHESYTVPYNEQLSVTGIRANYVDIHPQFEATLDPYSDVFFFFHPGFGFPSPRSRSEETGEPMLQVSSPTEWGGIVPLILQSKCPMFVTGFSPADIERDIKSLSQDPDIQGNFDWVVTPGPNLFCSEKWEITDFDPRVMVKPNWGIWGIRGKTREIQERPFWQELLKIGDGKKGGRKAEEEGIQV